MKNCEIICTGYYASSGLDKDTWLSKIVNTELPIEESSEENYSDASVFLQGSCQLFAHCLHNKFGYKIYSIRCRDYFGLHIFCKSEIYGKEAYIDIRGITSDFNSFCDGLTGKDYSIDAIIPYEDSFESDIREDKGAEFGYRFAKCIVERCPERYDVNKLETGETV